MVDTYADDPTSEPSTAPPPGESAAEPSDRSALSARLALLAFAVYVVVGFVVILTVLGNERWFLGDEWTFMAGRETGNLADYFEPLNGHWVSLPLLFWRIEFELFGLHSYLPYQVPVVLLHLTAACLLRVIMRRVGVSPWISTVAAASFVLFSPGEGNIVWGFQITLVGSLVAGLAHLLLADHDGPVDRRDWIGLALGFVGLLSSGVAIMMVVGVGLAVLLRRGWRLAAFHTVPLGIVYLVWYAIYRPQTAVYTDEVGVGHYVSLGGRYIWMGVSGVFTSIGDNPIVGLALAAMFVVGLVLAWLPLDRRAFALQAGLPVAMLLSAVLLLLSSMASRGFVFGAAEARADRYLHIFVALTLPALAVAGNAIARRWRLLTPVVLVLFLVGVPGNIAGFGESPFGAPYFQSQRQLIFGIGRSDLADEVPPWVLPEPVQTPDMTIGWLRQMIDEGKVPDALPPAPHDANWPLRLGVAHLDEPLPDNLQCRVRERPLTVTPKVGQQLGIKDSTLITLLDDGQPVAQSVAYDPDWAGELITIELPDLELRFEPGIGADEFTLCS